MSTLTYATKASYITNQPTVNDDPRNKTINELKRQVKGLTEELTRANQHIEMLSGMQGHPGSERSEEMEERMVMNPIRKGTSEREPSLGGG